MASTAFLDQAEALLGPRGFSRDPDIVAPWLTDWRGRYTGQALALASPASTAEVAALVTLCASYRIPIVPQGGNSGMSGGATPSPTGDALLLSLRRMDRVRNLDSAAMQVTAEAGVILQNLHELAEREGLRFPLSLGGKGSATVGGLISTNAGGTQVLRHGSMRALTLGLEVVLPDGAVLDTLTPLKKDNRGWDLKQLFIGAEGTLGIVTAATLRLRPAVQANAVAFVALPSIAAAGTLLTRLQTDEPALEAFEVMPRHCLESVLAYLPDSRDPFAEPAPWYGLIELVDESLAPTPPTDRVAAQLAAALDAGLITDATIATSGAQAEALWQLREMIAPAERALGPAMQHDISVPVAAMPDFIVAAEAAVAAEFPGARPVSFGHLGDGNVHFHVLPPADTDGAQWFTGPGASVSARVHDLVTEWHGSISAEHGIGQLKRDELARLGDPVALRLLATVKQALDPQGLMNPGKLL